VAGAVPLKKSADFPERLAKSCALSVTGLAGSVLAAVDASRQQEPRFQFVNLQIRTIPGAMNFR